MGLYDTIYFNCPTCSSTVAAQSKSGECNMAVYLSTAVPVDVAADANRHAPHVCTHCGALWEFDNMPPPVIITLTLKRVG